MIPAIANICRLLCLQRTRGSFKYFCKITLLLFCRNMKSADHVPLYAGWLILSCSAPAHTHDFKNFLSLIQVFYCKTFPILWYDASYRCSCVKSSMSSPLHHLSYRRLSGLICLQAPVSLYSCFGRCPSLYCIPHAIIECRMMISISHFPCLAARFFLREDCSIRPLAPLFAYLWLRNSFIRQSVGSLICWFSSMRFHFDQESCCPRGNFLPQYLDGCCQNIRVRCPHKRCLSTFTNPPIDCLQQWLVVTQTQSQLIYQRVTKRQ